MSTEPSASNTSPSNSKNTNSTKNTNSRLSASSYSPLEEGINSISHGIGFLASLAAMVLLILKAAGTGSALKIVSFTLFGISLLTLYAASTLYHTSKTPKVRSRLKIFDHAAIYVLIAGTYTPFTLVTLQGRIGWIIFAVSWLIAVTGIILKLFFIGRFNVLSTIMYVLMGWIIIFAIRPLIDRLSAEGLAWLIGGGVSYTLGAVLYSIKKIPLNHALFHILVLCGSGCHFIAVYLYV